MVCGRSISFSSWTVSWKSELRFHGILCFPCIQRAEQLSNTLKKIATTETFTNFHLFYMDFAFHESKSLGFCLDNSPAQQWCGTVLHRTWNRLSRVTPTYLTRWLSAWRNDKARGAVWQAEDQCHLHHHSGVSESAGPAASWGELGLEASNQVGSLIVLARLAMPCFCVDRRESETMAPAIVSWTT